jgi:hypothetical protein
MGPSILKATSGLVPIVFVATLLYGCAATPYQPLNDRADASEGFSDTQLGPNTYEVNFRGNNNTTRERASDFALLRAAELCLLNGYRYFVVTSSRELTSAAMYANQHDAETISPANVFGINSASVSTTTYRGAPRTTYTRPRRSMVVGFLETPMQSAEDLGLIYDAESLHNSIRTKYEMSPLDSAENAPGQ